MNTPSFRVPAPVQAPRTVVSPWPNRPLAGKKSGAREGAPPDLWNEPRAGPATRWKLSLFGDPDPFQPAGVLDHRLLRRRDAQGIHQRPADRQDPVGGQQLIGL